jgi:hypothetical protein
LHWRELIRRVADFYRVEESFLEHLDSLDDSYEADTFVKCLDLTSLDLSVDESVLKAEERI